MYVKRPGLLEGLLQLDILNLNKDKIIAGDDFFDSILLKIASLVDKDLSEGQYQTFFDYYLTLKYSIFWPYLVVGIDEENKDLQIVIMKKISNHQDWILKKLEFVAKISAMAYFGMPKKEIGVLPYIVFEFITVVRARPKAYLYVASRIIGLVLSYTTKIDPTAETELVEKIIKSHPVYKELKERLVKEKIITSDYRLNFPHTLADVRRELQAYYLKYMIKHQPHRCPVCGIKYVKTKKNQATCGKTSCKRFKSDMKQAIKAMLEEKQTNIATMSFDDFYSFVQQWNDLRKKRCKGKRPKKIFSLKELSRIILKELQ